MGDAPTFIAFRYDRTQVFFPAGNEGSAYFDFDWDRTKNLKDLGAPNAKDGPEGLWAADAELLSDHYDLFDRAHIGDKWQLEISPTSRIDVIVKEPVLAEVVGNSMAGFLAEVTLSNQPAFNACTKETFLVHRASAAPDQRPRPRMRITELPEWKAPSELRSQIEELLNARMKTELAAMHHFTYQHDDATTNYPEFKEQFERWRRFDHALANGRGKLDYDTQAFQLTPDGVPRLFIRSRWMVDEKPAFLMSAWLRAQPQPIIETADAGQSEILRMSEGYAPDLETLGVILNVFDRNDDGYGEFLILRRGWESFGIQLLRYTETGPAPTKVSFGGGA